MSGGRDEQQSDKRHSSAAAFEERHERKTRRADSPRRCGRRAPTDKTPCTYPFGHRGRHSWQADWARSRRAPSGSAGSTWRSSTT